MNIIPLVHFLWFQAHIATCSRLTKKTIGKLTILLLITFDLGSYRENADTVLKALLWPFERCIICSGKRIWGGLRARRKSKISVFPSFVYCFVAGGMQVASYFWLFQKLATWSQKNIHKKQILNNSLVSCNVQLSSNGRNVFRGLTVSLNGRACIGLKRSY